METWLADLDHWHWWVLAVILLIVEVLAPAFFFLWLGVAAGITGLLLLLIPALGWKSQVLAFSVLSVLSIAVWHGVLRKHPTRTRQPGLNRRGQQYVGQQFVLDQAIQNGTGRIRVEDTVWMVAGADRPAGSKVRITGMEGATFLVEPVWPEKSN